MTRRIEIDKYRRDRMRYWRDPERALKRYVRLLERKHPAQEVRLHGLDSEHFIWTAGFLIEVL